MDLPRPFDPDLERALAPAQRALLDRYGFHLGRFAEGRARLRARTAFALNFARGTLAPPAAAQLPALPPPGSAARRHLAEIGNAAIARGEVAAILLNGGMATRLGGVVKASVDALPGRSFLTLKLADLRATARRAAGRLPVLLMNSFATDAPTAALLAAQPPRPELALSTFAQAISVRLTEAGDIFTGADGHPSLYAPGHGDLTDALRRFALAALRAAGVRTLVMANLDNLAAGVEPAIVGHHRERHAQMTVEVVRKEKGDKGGAPALLDGRLQIVESMRFPPTFDQDAIPVFNTNTFVLELEPLDRDFPLDQFCVKKKVDDRDAIQFERLAGQLSAFLETGCIEVPRAGPDGRFLPAKDAEEIAARRAQFEEVLGARGALEE